MFKARIRAGGEGGEEKEKRMGRMEGKKRIGL